MEPRRLKALIKDVNSDLEYTGLVTADEDEYSSVPYWIPTGVLPLDMVLGGGIPVGKITEVFGAASTGKTTFLEHVFKQNQLLGGLSVLIDSDSSYIQSRAGRVGMDNKDLVVVRASYLEAAEEIIRTILRKLETDEYKDPHTLIVWDTITAAPTKKEYEEGKNAGGIAESPRVISGMLRVLTDPILKNHVALVLLSQIRATISRIPLPAQPPGGNGIQHHASIRLRTAKTGYYEDSSKKRLGIFSNFTTEKNKLVGRYRTANVVITDAGGIDADLTIFHLLYERGGMGVIAKVGNWYTISGFEKKELKFMISQFGKLLATKPGLSEYLQGIFLQYWKQEYPRDWKERE